tara:strand:+ start:2357 stop:2926 length:570 start_codon:yes stop_codon:yes gene_type:complete
MNPKKQEMIMRELEWGINSETNSLFLAGDVANETLHSMVVHLDTLLRINPEKDINLNINSFGGDTYAMFGIVDKMRHITETNKVKVNTICVGTCMSAAAVILAAGTGIRKAHKHSSIMVHDGQIGIQEKVADFQRASEHFKELTERGNKLMAECTKKDFDYWNSLSKFDSYFTAEEALEVGIIDEIIGV